MGCLFDFFLLPFEALFDFILNGWISLMQLIVPDKRITRGASIALKSIILVFSTVLLFIFIMGLLAAIFTEATVFELWKFIFIPLGIGLAQILLGVIVHFTVNKK